VPPRAAPAALLPLAFLFLAFLAPAPPAHADIYHGRDEDGVPRFSDRPEPGLALFLRGDGEALRDAAPAAPPRPDMRRYAAEIEAAAAEFGLAPALLHAVIEVESGYDPRAVSPKGAAGLMQLMPATARSLGVADRFDARANLRGGARFLQSLLVAFDGNLQLALAAYNAGEGAVRRHGMQIPPYAETAAYVRAVLRRYERLRRSGRGRRGAQPVCAGA
jgi:soluble lytic murein transglycosylase-like protein